MYLLGFYVSPIAVASALLICLLSFLMKSKSKKYHLPPGPLPLPVIGNLLTVAKEPDILTAFAKLRSKYGDIYKLKLGIQNMIIVNTTELTVEALVKKQIDFAGRPNMPSFVRFSEGGKNISLGDYTPELQMRRKLAYRAIKSFLSGPSLDDKVTMSVENVLEHMSKMKEPFDPHNYIDLMLFNVVADICHGTRYELNDPDFTKIVEINERFLKLFGNGLLSDFIPWMSIFERSTVRQIDSIFETLKTDAQAIIEQHKENFDPNDPKDVMDYLLLTKHNAQEEGHTELLNELTDVHLRQIMLDIIFAGTFTSSMTITWVILLVMRHPEVQVKMHKEIDSVLGQAKMKAKLTESFPYCRAVIREAMRISPIVPFGLPRATTCDTTLGGYDIPKDTQVLFNIWDLHHDPQQWDNPLKFNPERFLDESGMLSGKPASFLPFMAGRRVCLGESIAKPEMLIIVISIFQKFHISSPPGEIPPVEGSLTTAGYMSPKYNILLEERC